MIPEDIQQVNSLIDKYASAAKYGVAHIPAHVHNGIDSSKINYNDLVNKPTASTGITQKTVQTTRAIDAASGSVDVAHGLGVVPKYVQVIARYTHNGPEIFTYSMSDGWSDGTNNREARLASTVQGTTAFNSFTSSQDTSFCLQIYARESASVIVDQVATATFDATNITLTFTKSGTSTYFTDNIYITLIATL